MREVPSPRTAPSASTMSPSFAGGITIAVPTRTNRRTPRSNKLVEHDRGNRTAHAERRCRHPATRTASLSPCGGRGFLPKRLVFRGVRRSGRCERGRQQGSPPRRRPPDGIRCTRRFETCPYLTPLALRDWPTRRVRPRFPAFAATEGGALFRIEAARKPPKNVSPAPVVSSAASGSTGKTSSRPPCESATPSRPRVSMRI